MKSRDIHVSCLSWLLTKFSAVSGAVCQLLLQTVSERSIVFLDAKNVIGEIEVLSESNSIVNSAYYTVLESFCTAALVTNKKNLGHPLRSQVCTAMRARMERSSIGKVSLLAVSVTKDENVLPEVILATHKSQQRTLTLHLWSKHCKLLIYCLVAVPKTV